MKVRLYKSKDGWRIRLIGRNGEIMLSSEAYSSLTKSAQSARKIAEAIGGKVEMTAEARRILKLK
jgi:uncharacterized protein YegP (UPF0339 family)